MSDTQEIRSAATIVLGRDGPSGMEVCLLRRSSKSSFMASVVVYPGGALEPSDRELARSNRIRASRELWNDISAREHAIAAVREAFEESGLLAADFGTPPPQSELDRLRGALREDRIRFENVLEELDAQLSLDSLWFFDRWVTPPWESKRFDAWFFLARAPEGQRVQSDGEEVTEERWMSPREALERYRRRELLLAPPTWATMRDLSRFEGLNAAIDYAKSATPHAVCPYFTTRDLGGDGVIMLPGDPEYPGFDGVDTSLRGTPTRTRIRMRDGLWEEWSE